MKKKFKRKISKSQLTLKPTRMQRKKRKKRKKKKNRATVPIKVEKAITTHQLF